jgi:hypothetical protein
VKVRAQVNDHVPTIASCATAVVATTPHASIAHDEIHLRAKETSGQCDESVALARIETGT